MHRGEIQLAAQATLELLAPYAGRGRLWLARTEGIQDLHRYLNEHGHPIRYGYVRQRWPLSAYQTVYATAPGSAEMPSAGRPFTAELLTRLIAMGVLIAPVTLHAGVSSPEAHESPYPEDTWFQRQRHGSQPRPRGGTPRDRNRNHRRPRPRVGRTAERNRRCAPRLDQPCDLKGASGPGRGRPADRVARARASHLQMLEVIGDSGWWSAPTRVRWHAATSGTSSVTAT